MRRGGGERCHRAIAAAPKWLKAVVGRGSRPLGLTRKGKVGGPQREGGAFSQGGRGLSPKNGGEAHRKGWTRRSTAEVRLMP